MRRVLTIFITSLVAGTAAQAGPMLFATPSNSSVAGGNVSAEAEFTFSASTLTLVLRNKQEGITNAGQLLTDIFFSLSDVDTASLTAVTGTQIRLDGGSGAVNPLVSNWRLQTGIAPFAAGFHLDMLFQQPNLGIIGPNPNPNSSLTGSSHNPLYDPVCNVYYFQSGHNGTDRRLGRGVFLRNGGVHLGDRWQLYRRGTTRRPWHSRT